MLRLRKGGHKDLERYYTLMEMDFDSEELFSKLNMHRAISNGALEFYIVNDEDTGLDTGYVVLCTKGIYGYVLLKYMAVFPWYRGKGVGIETMRLLNRTFAAKQGMIAELTEFEDPDPDHLKKLFKFFQRFGYTEIDSDYRIGGSTAHVMVKPFKGTAEIAPVFHRMIPDYYSRILSAYAMSRMIDIQPVKPAAEKESD